MMIFLSITQNILQIISQVEKNPTPILLPVLVILLQDSKSISVFIFLYYLEKMLFQDK